VSPKQKPNNMVGANTNSNIPKTMQSIGVTGEDGGFSYKNDDTEKNSKEIYNSKSHVTVQDPNGG